jgi:hypothetical protein
MIRITDDSLGLKLRGNSGLITRFPEEFSDLFVLQIIKWSVPLLFRHCRQIPVRP